MDISRWSHFLSVSMLVLAVHPATFIVELSLLHLLLTFPLTSPLSSPFKLRILFLPTERAIENLVDLLKKFSIRLAHQSIVQLFVRVQWEIEADNEFSMAMGTDTALATQN